MEMTDFLMGDERERERELFMMSHSDIRVFDFYIL